MWENWKLKTVLKKPWHFWYFAGCPIYSQRWSHMYVKYRGKSAIKCRMFCIGTPWSPWVLRSHQEPPIAMGSTFIQGPHNSQRYCICTRTPWSLWVLHLHGDPMITIGTSRPYDCHGYCIHLGTPQSMGHKGIPGSDWGMRVGMGVVHTNHQ